MIRMIKQPTALVFSSISQEETNTENYSAKQGSLKRNGFEQQSHRAKRLFKRTSGDLLELQQSLESISIANPAEIALDPMQQHQPVKANAPVTPQSASQPDSTKKRNHGSYAESYKATAASANPKRKKHSACNIFDVFSALQMRDIDTALYFFSKATDQIFSDNRDMSISVAHLIVPLQNKHLISSCLSYPSIVKAISTPYIFNSILERSTSKATKVISEHPKLMALFKTKLYENLCKSIITCDDAFASRLLDCSDNTIDLGIHDNRALRMAVERGQQEIVKKLLQNHGVVSQFNPVSSDLLNLAVQNHHYEIAALLHDAGADIEFLPRATRASIVEISTKWLIDEMAKYFDANPLDEADSDGIVPGYKLSMKACDKSGSGAQGLTLKETKCKQLPLPNRETSRQASSRGTENIRPRSF